MEHPRGNRPRSCRSVLAHASERVCILVELEMDLTAERTRVLTHAKQIVAKAKADSRDLTDHEQDELETDMGRIKVLDRQLEGRKMADAVKALDSSGGDDDRPRASVFNDDDRTRIAYAVKSRTAYRTDLNVKAVLTTGAMLPSAGTIVQPGLHQAAYPLSGLFQQVDAPGPVQRYYRSTAGTAAVVAEAALKPDSGVAFQAVDLPLDKLACLAQFSDEMSNDAPFLIDHLSQELQAAVAQAENARIVNTWGSTSGVLTGAGTNATVVDSIADAIAGQESISGLTPSIVVANPTVVAAIRKTKASTSGTYVLDPTEPGPSSIFGVPVVSTPATSATVVWVVEPTGIAIYRRGGLTVEFGWNADDWAHNTQTARAEERMATAVMRPSALTKITLS